MVGQPAPAILHVDSQKWNEKAKNVRAKAGTVLTNVAKAGGLDVDLSMTPEAQAAKQKLQRAASNAHAQAKASGSCPTNPSVIELKNLQRSTSMPVGNTQGGPSNGKQGKQKMSTTVQDGSAMVRRELIFEDDWAWLLDLLL